MHGNHEFFGLMTFGCRSATADSAPIKVGYPYSDPTRSIQKRGTQTSGWNGLGVSETCEQSQVILRGRRSGVLPLGRGKRIFVCLILDGLQLALATPAGAAKVRHLETIKRIKSIAKTHVGNRQKLDEPVLIDLQ